MKKDYTQLLFASIIIGCTALILSIAYEIKSDLANILQRQVEERDSLIEQLQVKAQPIEEKAASIKVVMSEAELDAAMSGKTDVVTARANVTYYDLQGITAIGKNPCLGMCAVSRDLEAKGFKLGKFVKVEGYGTLLIADRTNARIKNTVDIYVLKGMKIKNGKNVKITLIPSQKQV